jgi:hypothetical protein
MDDVRTATGLSLRAGASPALANAGLGALLAAVIVWVGPPGTDLPAHVFQLDLYVRHGFDFWTNYWYAGRYTFVGYSLLYYPLAAILGIKPLAVLSVAVSAAAFTVLIRDAWPEANVWAGRFFALLTAAALVSAAFPWGLGLAFALCALVAVSRRRVALFGVLAALAAASSPLAFLFLLLVLAAAWLSGHRHRVVKPAVVIAAICGCGLLVWRLFPDSGRYPFPFSELLAALTFCVIGAALTWRVPEARLLRSLFVAYAGLCLISYALPSDVGGNIVRLRYAAVPLAVLALSLRRWRPIPVAALVIALATSWNVSPLVYSLIRSSHDPAADSAYWSPVISYLHEELAPGYRVEAVGTANHWEAVYLPQAGIPIVRGWFRQDDFPQNQLLYQDPHLTPAEYLTWLRSLAVRYVVLTDSPADYSSRNEAALLRSGRSTLPVVDRTAHATIYAVPDPRPIVTGPASPTVASLAVSTVKLRLHSPGTYALDIRYSPYLVTSSGCLAQGSNGMTTLVVPQAGTVKVAFQISAGAALAALTGDRDQCPRPQGAR